MAKENLGKSEDLIQLLREGIEYFNCIRNAVDVSDQNMPVVSEDNNTIIHTYFMLYGILNNRHGEFDNFERYNSFMNSAIGFRECPELMGFVERIHRARINLERAIRDMKPEEITKLGYFSEENLHMGRLVLFRQGE